MVALKISWIQGLHCGTDAQLWREQDEGEDLPYPVPLLGKPPASWLLCSISYGTFWSGSRVCHLLSLNNINKKVKENVNMPTLVKGTDHSWYVAHLANSREPGSNRVRETQAWGSSPALQPRPPHLPRLTSAHQSQLLPPPRLSSAFLQSKITYCTAEVMYNMPGFTNLKVRNRLFLAVGVALPKRW